MIWIGIALVWGFMFFAPIDPGPPPYDTCVCEKWEQTEKNVTENTAEDIGKPTKKL
jgi:hypothetical protein